MPEPSPAPTRPAVAAAGWLALIALGAYAFVRHVVADAHGNASPVLAFDPFGLYYPMLDYGFAALRGGRLPLWNPYQLAGVPFLATFYPGLLYPLNVAYLLLPVHVAMGILAAGHVVLAGLAAALYARLALRVSLVAALAAGVVFMLNTYTLWAFSAQNQLYSLPWIPLLLLAVDRTCATRRPEWVAALAAAIALPILGGNLQTLSYEAYAVAPYALVCLWRNADGTRGALRRAALLAAGVVVGLAVSAPQLLPTLELSALSTRSARGLTVEQIAPFGALPLPTLQQFLDGARKPLTFAYAGTVVFLTLPFALLSGKRRARAVALAVAAVLTGLVAHGLSNPIGRAFVHLPMGNWFRELSRAWPVAMLCVAALAGLGLDGIRTTAGARDGRRMGAAIAGLALALALVALVPARARWLCGGAGALLVALRAGVLRGRAAEVAATALLVMLAADYLSTVPVNHTIVPFAGGEHHLLDMLRDAITGGQIERPGTRSVHEYQLFNVATTPKLGTLFRVPTFDDDEPFAPPRYREWGLRMTGATNVAAADFYLGGWNLHAPAFDPRFLDYAGVGSIVLLHYAVRQPPPSVAGLGPPARVPLPSPRALGAREPISPLGREAYRFTNTFAWPRAFVAHDVRVVASGTEALDALAALPRGTAPLAVVETASDADLAGRGADGSATVVESEPEHVVVRTGAPGPALLVLLDTALPGWQADVDGTETPILQTNYLFRGVRVPAGTHTVTFRYAPRSVPMGLAIGAGGMLALGLLLTSAAGRARRRARVRATA